ncbi:hypothetical protein FNV43_RR15337 [Rhamnella rubrinervis]|uniref:Uncharacterized protein n=1 Tax=Rhamnella rubrinervis TaxID=2594499 RepID=A0A8K0E7L1_9ROSA|nr:hypothetical protein FNV43_RR15337 [Rhamnella rubrinervis]
MSEKPTLRSRIVFKAKYHWRSHPQASVPNTVTAPAKRPLDPSHVLESHANALDVLKMDQSLNSDLDITSTQDTESLQNSHAQSTEPMVEEPLDSHATNIVPIRPNYERNF